MTDFEDFEDFELLPSKGLKIDPNNIGFAVYVGKTHGAQLNIKLGLNIINTLGVEPGDRLELRYSVGKRQVLIKKGEHGFTVRPDGSFRRNITKSWHQEPFPSKEMPVTQYEILALDNEKVIVQLPKDIIHD